MVWALPINWDTPTNLEYQGGWGSLAFVVGTVALVFGSAEAILWARGVRVGALAARLLGAAFAFAGMGVYLDGPANGDEMWTAGREQVVMSQLVWGGYWVAQTLVAAVWLLLLGRPRVSRPDIEAPTSVV